MPGSIPDEPKPDRVYHTNIGDGIAATVTSNGNTTLTWGAHRFHIPAAQVEGIVGVLFPVALARDPERDWSGEIESTHLALLDARARQNGQQS
jgi:hypothetical protein